jgi:hypothetical protein
MTAAQARTQLLLLEEERVAARAHGLLADPRYRADLERDIRTQTEAYVGAAVTEIAALRAAISGPLLG